MTAILQTSVNDVPCRRGKVRDVYDLGDRVVLVATDRISAFDWVFSNGIPDKGKILTSLSLYWFDFLGVEHHLLSTELREMGSAFENASDVFAGRSILARKVKIVPIECVVRGYLAGSGWKEYREHGTLAGQRLAPGLVESDRLSEPAFTPAIKAESGHDENISISQMAQQVGCAMTKKLRRLSLSIYERACSHALEKGIILADTKFEFGLSETGELILADEVLTPDSSRFWPANAYRPGQSQPSFDKQYVRDWLESIGYDKMSPPPPLPPEVIERTREKYIEAHDRLTGRSFLSSS